MRKVHGGRQNQRFANGHLGGKTGARGGVQRQTRNLRERTDLEANHCLGTESFHTFSLAHTARTRFLTRLYTWDAGTESGVIFHITMFCTPSFKVL